MTGRLLHTLLACAFIKSALPGLSQLIGGRTEGCGPWVPAQAMIQSMLEADELANEGVVAAVGTRSFEGELSVEIEFCSVIKWSARGEETSAAEAGPRHPDKAGRDARTALLEILQSLKDAIRTGEVGEQHGGVRDHEGEDPEEFWQKASTTEWNDPGSRAG